MRTTILSTLLLAGALSLQACHTTAPPNRGQSGYRLDPTHDSPSEYGAMGIRSADLVNATDRMAMDLAGRPDIMNRPEPPRIVVGRIENQTSMPEQNYQVFLARLRSQLSQAGTRHGIEFIRERDFVETQRAREYGDGDPYSGPDGYRSRADYVLTCAAYDLPSGGSNYFLLDYQLVQLRDVAAAPDDPGAGTIVWENAYEVKYH